MTYSRAYFHHLMVGTGEVLGRSRNLIQSRNKNLSLHLMISSLAIFTIKFLIILNLQFGAWLGADGESYIDYAKKISEYGLFAKGIIYWPAGYPVIIWLSEFFSRYESFFILTILQTVFFSLSVWFLAKNLMTTKIKSVTLYVFYFISLNPTLALTSISIGYESICASCLILFIAYFLRDFRHVGELSYSRNLLFASLLAGLASSMQPRLIPGFLISISIWVYFKFKQISFKILVYRLFVSFIIFSLLPTGLIMRNYIAEQSPVLSTNLGVNMVIGAGPNASGSYGNGSSNVECGDLPTAEMELDRARTRCALNWYLKNPSKFFELSVSKSTALWSPWWGPLAAGTMARNPYLNFHPVRSLITTQDQLNVVIGPLGKGFAWLLILGNWLLMILGFRKLLKLGLEEKILAYFTASAILGTWLVTLITFGDHRFRLPIMPLSLLLAVVGLFSFKKNRFDSPSR